MKNILARKFLKTSKTLLLAIMRQEWKSVEKIKSISEATKESNRRAFEGAFFGVSHDSQKIEGSEKKGNFELVDFALTPSQKPEVMIEAQKYHLVFLKMTETSAANREDRSCMAQGNV